MRVADIREFESVSTGLALQLRSYRKRVGCTQEELADMVEIPRATLAHLEKGRANPCLQTLLKLYRFGFAPEWMFPGEEEHVEPTPNVSIFDLDD